MLLKWIKTDAGTHELLGDLNARAMVEDMMQQILKEHGDQKSVKRRAFGRMASAFLKV